MFWVRERNVSLRRFFYSTKTYVYLENDDANIIWGYMYILLYD